MFKKSYTSGRREGVRRKRRVGGWVGWWGVNGEGLWVEERRRRKELGERREIKGGTV